MQEYQKYDYMDCEEKLLSLIINYPKLMENTILVAKYFNEQNRVLFSILKKEYEKRKCFVFEELSKYQDFDSMYYYQLASNNMYSDYQQMFRYYEKDLILRYKNKTTEELMKNYNGDFEEFYDKLTKVKNIDYNEAEYLTVDRMLNILEKEGEQIKIGFRDLDRSLNLNKNDFMVLAGGTGTGKTAFALNLLVNLSKDYQCIYINQEMSPNVIYRRIVSIKSGVDIRKLRDFNHLEVNDRNKVNQAISDIDDRKIILVNKVVDMQEMENTIANTLGDRHIIVIIDHIGLIRGTGKSLYEKMTEIAKEIRRLSMNYNCTIIGLCQLSREGQRGERAPTLQDLRDSGEIEQSARNVLLLYNPEPTEEQIQHMKVIIGKNGDGDKIIKTFDFDKYRQIFYEV